MAEGNRNKTQQEIDEVLEEREQRVGHEPQYGRHELNPSARGTAEGPEDEENQFGNDPVGPNLGEHLDDPNVEGDGGVSNVRRAREEDHYRSLRTGKTMNKEAKHGEELFRKEKE